MLQRNRTSVGGVAGGRAFRRLLAGMKIAARQIGTKPNLAALDNYTPNVKGYSGRQRSSVGRAALS
jgi:hypothetical protein